MALGVWLLVKASWDPFWYSVGRERLDRKSIVRKESIGRAGGWGIRL